MASMISKIFVKLRRLGFFEKNETYTHHLGFYSAVCCAMTYQSPRAGVTLSLPRLYAALSKLIKQQAVLAASILNGGSTEATFIRVPEIDLRRLVHSEQLALGVDRVDALNSTLEKRLSVSFDHLGELPLWRLLLLEPHDSDPEQDIDVVFFIHHGLADGVSAILFHQELQKALDELNDVDDHALPAMNPVVIPPALEFLPPLDDLHPLPVADDILARARLPPSTPAGLWTGGPFKYPTGECVRTRHTIHIVEAATFASLLAACKAHGMSFQPLLEALFARAIFDALDESGVAESNATMLTGACPINMRPYLSGNHLRSMGVLITVDTHEFKRGDDVWTSANYAKDAIAASLKNMDLHVNIGLFRFLGDIRDHYKDQIGTAREVTFEASNAGAAIPGIEGGWSFRRAVFSQSANAVGPTFDFSACSVKGGSFCIGTAWDDGVIEEKLVKGVFVHFDKLIRQITKLG